MASFKAQLTLNQIIGQVYVRNILHSWVLVNRNNLFSLLESRLCSYIFTNFNILSLKCFLVIIFQE